MPYAEVSHWGLDKESFKQRHVLFRADDRDSYVETMLRMILKGSDEP
jgi:hypothetical protein